MKAHLELPYPKKSFLKLISHFSHVDSDQAGNCVLLFSLIIVTYLPVYLGLRVCLRRPISLSTEAYLSVVSGREIDKLQNSTAIRILLSAVLPSEGGCCVQCRKFRCIVWLFEHLINVVGSVTVFLSCLWIV